MLEAKLACKQAKKGNFKMVVINFQSYLQPKTIKSLYNLGTTEGCLSLFTRPHYYIAWKKLMFFNRNSPIYMKLSRKYIFRFDIKLSKPSKQNNNNKEKLGRYMYIKRLLQTRSPPSNPLLTPYP